MRSACNVGILGIASAALLSAACGAGPASNSASSDALNAAAGLRPGEVAELTVNGGVASGTIVSSPSESYVVVIASNKLDTSGTELPWSIDTSAPVTGKARVADGCAIDAAAWSAIAPPAETPPAGAAVALGATKTLHASKAEGTEDIQVKAIAVGQRAVVWADVTPAHPAVLDDAFVTQFLSDFENTILPRERSVFGIESDVDADGHIGLVFTPLTHETAVAFFTSCDIVASGECRRQSNGGDYLWLTPPNAIAPPYNTANAIKEILTHELSHLIHFNRKVVRNRLSSWPDSGYMDEGVGGFAQDVVGPQAGNLYVAMAGLDGIADFSLANTLVDGSPYDMDRDGVLRGGSYLFVRWLYDRAGGDVALANGSIEGHGGPAFLRKLLDAPESIAKTLPRATQHSLEDIGTDFYTALAMSNRDEAGGVAPTNKCFSYLPTQIDPVTGKQRGADLYAQFHGMHMNGVATTDATSGKVRAGGAAYVTLPGANGALNLTVNVDPSAKARVRIGRIK